MSDWTPTTEVIRHAVSFPRERLGEPRPIKPAAFDRWLEQVRAEAWEEGYGRVRDDQEAETRTGQLHAALNPYRQEQDA